MESRRGEVGSRGQGVSIVVGAIIGGAAGIVLAIGIVSGLYGLYPEWQQWQEIRPRAWLVIWMLSIVLTGAAMCALLGLKLVVWRTGGYERSRSRIADLGAGLVRGLAAPWGLIVGAVAGGTAGLYLMARRLATIYPDWGQSWGVPGDAAYMLLAAMLTGAVMGALLGLWLAWWLTRELR